MKQRIDADKFRINGIELAPAEKTIEWGKKIIDFRAGDHHQGHQEGPESPGPGTGINQQAPRNEGHG